MIFIIWLAVVLASSAWTADEAGYVLSITLSKTVELNWLEGFAINCVSGSLSFPFDVIVWILRSVGVI